MNVIVSGLFRSMEPTLARLGSAAESLHRLVGERVDELRRREVSWTTIGDTLGISRQAAWERFS